MQSMNYFFNKIANARTIMCSINKEEDISVSLRIATEYSIERLLLVSEDKKNLYNLTEKLNEYKFDRVCPNMDIRLIHNNKGCFIDLASEDVLEDIIIDTILFTSGVEYNDLMSWVRFKPKVLIGKFYYSEIDYYNIWVAYRKLCNNIFFEVIMPSGKMERLEWEKGTTDIELSVIFPVYNVEKYLKKCLETVTKWNADYVEFLFVNDGSPDNSAEMLIEYGKKDSRIKVINKANGGCASARKLGLEKAQGRYIGFIDPDDFIESDMFYQLHKKALLGSYQVAYCGYNEYYENTGTVKKVTQDALYAPYSEGVRDEISIKKLIMYLRVAIWRGIYLKSMLVDNKITFNESFRRFDDLPFKIEVFSKAKSVIAIPEFMYYYRLERPGQDVACSDERLYVHFDIFKYLDQKKELIQDARIRDYLQISKLQTHLYALEKIENKYFNKYVAQMKKDMRHNMGSFKEDLIVKAYLGNAGIIKKYLINLGLGKLSIRFSSAERKKRKLLKERNRAINELKKMY